MKLLITFLLVGLVLYAYVKEDQKINRTKRLNMARYAFESGCYNEAHDSCSTFDSDEDRADCYNHALENCPTNAERFRDWIAQGKK